MSSNMVTLIVDGQTIEKTWSDIHIKRSMDGMCSSFDLVTTQKQPFNYKDWPIHMGSKCDVYADGEMVLRGFIEDLNIDYSKDTHTVQVAGRDVTCDLVDCQKANPNYEYSNSTVRRVVENMCAPFSISVVVDPSAASAAAKVGWPVFYVWPGDPVLGSIYRITRLVKTFVIATTDGRLMITGAGSRNSATNLVSGVNILRGGLKQSDKERFSVYYIKGMSADNEGYIKSQEWLWMNGTYHDTTMTRYRPYASMAEHGVNIGSIGWLSKAEAQYRIGNSRHYNYTVQGWRENDGGALWSPNTNIQVTDPTFGLDKESFLIESVDYTQTDQGTLTQLGLCSKEKYTAEAELNRIKTIFEEESR
jgi:prophage tail gpP-like protein